MQHDRSPSRLGEYEILCEIGRGGMGIVYQAVQVSLGRRVAVKVLPPAISADPILLKRFEREARSAGKLTHPNIVPVYSVGSDWNTHYYVMEYVEGRTLDQLVQEMRDARDAENGEAEPLEEGQEEREPPSSASDQPREGATVVPDRGPLLQTTCDDPLKPSEQTRSPGATSSCRSADRETTDLGLAYMRSAANMVAQAADGLGYAHREGVIHRDIKPSNLILANDGRVLVMDFGLARDMAADGLTLSGEFMGTPLYMSPEQIMTSRVGIDHRTDIYSLGVVLYELCALQPVFRGATREILLHQIAFKEPAPPRKLNKRIPRDLETITLKCLEKDPDRRYKTADDIAADLRRFVAGDDVVARRSTVFYRGWKRMRQHRGTVAAILLALAVLSVVCAHYSLARSRARRLGQDMIEERRRTQAAARYEKCLRTAHAHLAAGECQAAHEQVRKALEMDHIPNRSKAHDLLDTLRQRRVLPHGFMRAANTTCHPRTGLPRRIVCKRDGSEMALVEAGEVTMGSPERRDEGPHKVTLGPFYMDVHEVTRGQYGAFEKAHPKRKVYGVAELWDRMARSDHMLDFELADRWPAVAVRWSWAKDYCIWAGKALPSEAEWEKAARGPDGRAYPWGAADPDSSVACFGRRWDSTPSDVMCHPEGRSPYGCADMAGNVAEWCQDYYDPQYYAGSPARDPLGPLGSDVQVRWRVVRGGSFSSSRDELRCARRSKANPNDQATHIGFRGCLPSRYLRFALPVLHPGTQIQWVDSLADGLREATAKNPSVIVSVGPTSSPWSRYVALNLFAWPDVIDAGRDFVCVRIASPSKHTWPEPLRRLGPPIVALVRRDATVHKILIAGLCTVDGFAFDDPRDLARVVRQVQKPLPEE